ncbi:MAG TPA: thioredoxin domain-containing protein, partial [Chthoniobacterales bacterium]
MKRSLPFIIIALVGLLAIGGGYFFYRFKMQPITPAATPVPAAVANTSAAGNPTTSAATDSSVAPTVPPLLAKRDDDTAKHIRGSATAPVTLEIYGDFQCPSCAHTAMVIKELEAQYGDRLREIFYEFPLAMH